MKTLQLNVFGITIQWDEDNPESAHISSTMHEERSPDNVPFNVGVDAIESMILAHFCAGIDIESSQYLEGIETAYLALGNNIESEAFVDSKTLPTCDGHYYQWLQPTQTEDGLRYLHINGDEIDLSDLMFESPHAATQAIIENTWGMGVEDAAELVLVEVKKRQFVNPFSLTEALPVVDANPFKGLKLAIHLEGGLVQNVFCHDKRAADIAIMVFDYDLESVDDEDIKMIGQGDNTEEPAYVRWTKVNTSPAIDLRAALEDEILNV